MLDKNILTEEYDVDDEATVRHTFQGEGEERSSRRRSSAGTRRGLSMNNVVKRQRGRNISVRKGERERGRKVFADSPRKPTAKSGMNEEVTQCNVCRRTGRYL